MELDLVQYRLVHFSTFVNILVVHFCLRAVGILDESTHINECDRFCPDFLNCTKEYSKFLLECPVLKRVNDFTRPYIYMMQFEVLVLRRVRDGIL
jgi:hypothetical protein